MILYNACAISVLVQKIGINTIQTRPSIAIIAEIADRADLIELGLRAAGYEIVSRLDEMRHAARGLQNLSPEIVIFDLVAPPPPLVNQVLSLSEQLFRPVVIFVDNAPQDYTAQAVDAGIAAYVADGLRQERIAQIVELALRRFEKMAHLYEELDEARRFVRERQTIDQAKKMLMAKEKIDEATAYKQLRSAAMNQSQRIFDIAHSMVQAG